ncbi:MAG: sigma-70 family RNA polymerase sigma [Prolixibacteraceae bacterium]|nr:MAG: sigma-70 family RNA polymerase sigma [Prolixibacteraceae bacterium]
MQNRSVDNESLLWEEFKKGNQIGLSKIYLNNVTALYNFGCKFTIDKNLVKDCIQDIFITLIQTRSKLSDTRHVKGYLLKSLKRKIIRELVKKQKFDEIVESGDYLFEINFESLSDIGNEDDNYMRRAFEVHAALESITSRQKEALYLRFNLGLSHIEIADVLHLSSQSSRALVSRAIQKIREITQPGKKQIQNIISLFLATGNMFFNI